LKYYSRNTASVGLTAYGFDFMGYWFAPGVLDLAPKTTERMLEKPSWLYEQGAGKLEHK
jgi:hypothetical protein